MNKKYILFFLFGLLSITISAQSLAEAKALYEKGEYEEAKPAFKKLVKTQPGNGNYNLWYGVCCLETGEPAEALKHLESAVKRRVPSGQLYLARAYNDLYQFEDAIETYETYISDLRKRKRSTEEAEQLLEKSKSNLRMLKGVEEVCFIDSFVVDKEKFLDAYKISPESGKLFMYDTYFNDSGKEGGTVYETELGNKLYYSEMQPDSTLSILSRNKLLDKWSDGSLLPGSINEAMNADYPYVLTDGITIYYASDGPGSMGGYDIFVTRYNTNTDSYLMPENVGMPFNSPYNDYMYVIDEFNDLGWFASDRYQPEGKVCIYVFIPNSSKQVYNYEGMDPDKMISLAQLHSIKDTWTDTDAVKAARERLRTAANAKPRTTKKHDFQFVIDDHSTYYQLDDFRSPQAKALYGKYNQLEQSYKQLQEKLEDMRSEYSRANKQEKDKMSAAILDLEQRVRQLSTDGADCHSSAQPGKTSHQIKTTMDILIIASLIIGAVILFLVELFVIPGISVAGFLAGGCIIFANYYAFAYMGTTAGVITLIISALACIGSLVWFMRSKTLDKIALKKNITSKVDRSAEEKVKVGDIGVTTTRLALIGYAEINGDIVEVKSSDGFLNEKTPIIVDRIADGVLLVERLKQ